jgi:predicted type IV restriction endonuclease
MYCIRDLQAGQRKKDERVSAMDFADKVRELSTRVQKQAANIQTEEATKNAMVMPFISMLGYNVFDPTEVTPELHADVGLKKGEKVDYAILKDGKPIMLFECKWHGADLKKEHASQLYRYFSVTEARFGVLTNGLVYRFYTDLDAPNKMDAKPFFEFDLTSYRDHDLEELKKFSKSVYDLEDILTTASDLKYTTEIQRILARQFQQPTEDFVRFFTAQVYQGRMTQAIREQFTQTTQRAFRQFVNEKINERLQSALGAEAATGPGSSQQATADAKPTAEPADPPQATIVTTDEERECFYTVKAILDAAIDSQRLALRDVQTYCGILLDNNNRKPICRLYLDGSRKMVGLFDADDRKEERVRIERVEDLHNYADRLKATLRHYELIGAAEQVKA